MWYGILLHVVVSLQTWCRYRSLLSQLRCQQAAGQRAPVHFRGGVGSDLLSPAGKHRYQCTPTLLSAPSEPGDATHHVCQNFEKLLYLLSSESCLVLLFSRTPRGCLSAFSGLAPGFDAGYAQSACPEIGSVAVDRLRQDIMALLQAASRCSITGLARCAPCSSPASTARCPTQAALASGGSVLGAKRPGMTTVSHATAEKADPTQKQDWSTSDMPSCEGVDSLACLYSLLYLSCLTCLFANKGPPSNLRNLPIPPFDNGIVHRQGVRGDWQLRWTGLCLRQGHCSKGRPCHCGVQEPAEV